MLDVVEQVNAMSLLKSGIEVKQETSRLNRKVSQGLIRESRSSTKDYDYRLLSLNYYLHH
jgi:hypothetical protein